MVIENEERSKDAWMPQQSHYTTACSGKLMRFSWRQRWDSSAADDTKLPHISSGVSWVLALLICFPAAVRFNGV